MIENAGSQCSEKDGRWITQITKLPKITKWQFFRMSLQYLKKEVRDEVDFFHVDKYQSFL